MKWNAVKHKTKHKLIRAAAAGLAVAALLGGCVPAQPSALSVLEGWGISKDSDKTGGRTGSDAAAAKDSSGNFSNSGPVKYLKREQRALILSYMNNWYNSLTDLKARDLVDFFAEPGGTQALGNQTALEVLVGSRGLQATDLRLSYYIYTLNCKSVTKNSKGDYTVKINEDCSMNFREYPGLESKSYAVEHVFVLTQTGGGWLIKGHAQLDSLYDMVLGDDYIYPLWGEMKNARKVLAQRKQNMLAENQSYVRSRLASKSSKAAITWDNDYNRQAAVQYAQNWVGQRNTKKWPKYDNYGGNCQNFVSQCLYNGGIPMDYTGKYQWKWYGTAVNNSKQTRRGRSSSWSGVEDFLTYSRYNTGYGLVSKAGADYYTGEIGDVIHMGTSQRWRHTVIITKVMPGGDGKTKDYLIASNTANVVNYPASAFVYCRHALIKIYGWNNPTKKEMEQMTGKSASTSTEAANAAEADTKAADAQMAGTETSDKWNIEDTDS